MSMNVFSTLRDLHNAADYAQVIYIEFYYLTYIIFYSCVEEYVNV